MTEFFGMLLIMSCAGTVLTLLLILLKPLTSKFFSASWNYYIWFLVIVVMIIPLKIDIPELYVHNSIEFSEKVTQNDTETVTATDNFTEFDAPVRPVTLQRERNIPDFIADNMQMISNVWILVALCMFLWKIIAYMLFLRKMYKNSTESICEEIKSYTSRKVLVRKSKDICSPLLIGVFKPVLILPEIEVTKEQLYNVLAHEMTHLKRNDVLLKWISSFVKCVHWFNPAVYYIEKEIGIQCEISCDNEVVKNMNEQQGTEYAETILWLITKASGRTNSMTTGMTGRMKIIRRRFVMMKNKKTISKKTKVLSVILAGILLMTTVFVGGVLADDVLGNTSNEIEVRDNGKLIEFKNNLFIKNGIVYLPLRELMENTGLVGNDNTYINWENGKITVSMSESTNRPEFDDNGREKGSEIVALLYCYGLEIGKSELILNPLESIPENRQYKSISNSMENAPIIKNGITYIPYEYVEIMINRVMKTHNVTVFGETEGFIWPSESDVIIADYGKRVHPITGEEKVHNGIDIAASENSNVKASISGSVTDTGFESVMGNYVEIKNQNGFEVYYGHLSEVNVKNGDTVKQNDIIGKVGKTGTATGANLHFEIRINGKPYDPMNFFEIKNVDRTSPYTTLAGFLNAFKLSDYEKMKLYCTEEFINEYFSLLNSSETASALEVIKAERMRNIPIRDAESLKVSIAYEVPDAVDGKTVKFDFEKHPDGTYKICKLSYND